MQCPNCYMQSTPRDRVCYGCGQPLQGKRGWGGDCGPNANPGWAYFFAGACGLILVVGLGGCAPVLFGMGGASLCLGLSRLHGLPAVVRVVGCVLITAVAWLLFIAVIGAVRSL